MNVRIYIDGYNLYYGALKRTEFKWLDPVKLIKHVIRTSAPEHLLPLENAKFFTKYFTSPVEPKLSFSKTAEADQKNYHHALEAVYNPEEMQIIKGYHSVNPFNQRVVDKRSKSGPHPDSEVVEVWRIEEKQTDVNIAVEAMRDAFTCNDEQHFVFVSNDTDFFRLFETLNSLSHIHVGVIAPGLDKNRRPSVGMRERSEWVRSYFMPEELEQSQLPLKITGSVRGRLKQYIRKPMEWYGQRDLAVEIFEILFKELKKRNACYSWLEQAPYEGTELEIEPLKRPAIEMLDTEKDALLVRQHALAYCAHLKARKR